MTTGAPTARLPLWFKLLLALFALNALLSIGRSVTRTLTPDAGGIDLHVYWYAGHFVRQGDDPYLANRQRQEPSVPVHYLDGVTTETLPIAQPGLATLPVITPPLILLLTPTAFLSWPTARMLWLLCNLALMLSIPWLLVRLLPKGSLTAAQTLLIALIFFGFSATRVAVWTGQNTLLVFFLMIVALLLDRRSWLFSGIALGIAMSKYSVALPAFLILAYRRSYRALAVSLVVQAAALLALASLVQRPPADVLQTYLSLASRYIIAPGIHLATLFAQQSNAVSYAIMAGGLALLLWIGTWMLRARRVDDSAHDSAQAEDRQQGVEFHLLTILCLWVLLVAYHRIYDAAISIVFVALIVYGLSHREVWNLSSSGRTGVLAALILFVGVQMMPGEIVGRFLPAEQTEMWLRLVDSGITISLVVALALSIWLLRRALAGQDKALSRNV